MCMRVQAYKRACMRVIYIIITKILFFLFFFSIFVENGCY